MTREQLKKNWKVIEAYKDGATIQCRIKDSTDNWTTTSEPIFSKHWEYRIKPKFEPEMGDIILVRDNEAQTWTKRVFVEKTKTYYYKCLAGGEDKLIYIHHNKVGCVNWLRAKPLNC